MQPKKILIIEDEHDLRSALETGLTAAGYEVATEAASEVALQSLDRHKPDLILLDLFTKSIHGVHFLERLRNNPALAKMKVIVLTNIEHEGHKKKALALGAEQYLIKANTSISEVVAAVKEALAS